MAETRDKEPMATMDEATAANNGATVPRALRALLLLVLLLSFLFFFLFFLRRCPQPLPVNAVLSPACDGNGANIGFRGRPAAPPAGPPREPGGVYWPSYARPVYCWSPVYCFFFNHSIIDTG